MSDNPLTGGGWPSQEDLRRRDELNMKSAQKECLDFLGITTDQLKVAREFTPQDCSLIRGMLMGLKVRFPHMANDLNAIGRLIPIFDDYPAFDEEKP